jgi:hypothetical protein
MAIEILTLRTMKKILVYLPVVMLLFSCENNETEFKDFKFQTVYFPVQNPVRTLAFGDEILSDNSIDREGAFTIAANIGGLIDNKENRTLQIRLAPELVPTDPLKLLITNTTVADTLELLPAKYYKASSLSEIVIPAGKFDGRIRIDLTEDFFNDPKSIKLKYVLPLIIEKAKDSILVGKPSVSPALALRTKNSDWEIGKRPKDYVLFAINYANKYHGAHFHFGLDSVFRGTAFSRRTVYSKKPDIETNVITTVTTASLSEAIVNRLGGVNVGASFQMRLKFNDDKSIAISPVKGSTGATAISGSGKFVEAKDGIAWGGAKRKTLYLKYQFTDRVGDVHKCKDTLVYRSSGIVYREFTLK